MLNFILCDDNSAILSNICKMLESIFIKHNIDAEISLKATNAEAVISFLSGNFANVLIADIELKSDMSGLELAKKIRETNKDMYIIFTTGHLEYIMMAYKVKTFDFLAKPITMERFEDTILRLLNDMETTSKKYIKIGNKNTFISQDEIKYIQKDGMKLVFHTDNKKYETYSSFNKIESCLPENFVRCHKSYIANINKISDIKINENVIFFNDNNSCNLGPKYKDKVMEVMKNA